MSTLRANALMLFISILGLPGVPRLLLLVETPLVGNEVTVVVGCVVADFVFYAVVTVR